jgi:hypothetical protein
MQNAIVLMESVKALSFRSGRSCRQFLLFVGLFSLGE